MTGAVPNGNAQVAAQNQFNDPPPPGHQFFLVGVELTYNGASAKSNAFEVRMQAVGAKSVSYDSHGCGVLPDELDGDKDVFPGGVIAGNVCFDIDSADADSLVMYATGGFSSSTDVFFAVH